MVRHEKRRGVKVWVVDLRFRSRIDGSKERYRRDAQVQTRHGADAEERRVGAYFNEHGSIQGLLSEPKPEPEPKAVLVKTWDDAVTRYREVVLSTKKPTTRKGYEEL